MQEVVVLRETNRGVDDRLAMIEADAGVISRQVGFLKAPEWSKNSSIPNSHEIRNS